MSKNLIYVLNSYSDDESSHFHHIINLLEELAKQNIKVTLLIEKAYSVPTFSNPNIEIVPLKCTGITRFIELFKFISTRSKIDAYSVYIRITSISAIISKLATFNTNSRVFFWQSGTTHEWDCSQPIGLNKLKWFIKSYLPSYLARRTVDWFVTGPEYMAEYYSSVVGINKKKIRVLYNDIEVKRFRTDYAEIESYKEVFLKDVPEATGKKIILLVHKMSPVRKTSIYIPNALERVFNEHEDIFFLVVGGGAELPKIRSAIEAKGMSNRFKFMGEIPNKEIQKLYCIASIFIHPTYNEGFPRVMLEAMAAGLPFVSTDAGGVFDITPIELHGFISSRDSVEKFADNLDRLLNSENKWDEYGAVAKKYVERFDTPLVANMYKRILFDDI